jgi:hypothetical protein
MWRWWDDYVCSTLEQAGHLGHPRNQPVIETASLEGLESELEKLKKMQESRGVIV